VLPIQESSSNFVANLFPRTAFTSVNLRFTLLKRRRRLVVKV